MPENDACEGVVAALKRQHDRIRELLRALGDGRWRPDDQTGDDDALRMLDHARGIEACVTDIARIVASMRD